MWGIVISALGRFLAWSLGASTMKWITASVLWFGLAALLDLLLELLPSWLSADSLSGSAQAFPPEVWYFIDYFDIQAGFSMMLSAYAIRFLIRRIPVIG